MVTENIIQAVHQQLFADTEGQVFTVLDGASIADLRLSLYRHRPEHECLYRGELAPDIAEVAPYLVRLEPNAAFTQWVLTQGWGQHWGIFAFASADLHTLRQHFRRFLTVYDPDGKPLLFRYYDPRVLRAYLPTCNGDELATVFGPVTCYLLEEEQPNTILRFRMLSGVLQQEKRQIA